ncbi:hypothetical protein [Microcoleus sp. FACHB-672]|nr:hypothetical protein [Microcoleus sp. FACHB-672]MBD2041694.1 hypothetical protein [Microcoleus sp. FACHB-672]
MLNPYPIYIYGAEPLGRILPMEDLSPAARQSSVDLHSTDAESGKTL